MDKLFDLQFNPLTFSSLERIHIFGTHSAQYFYSPTTGRFFKFGQNTHFSYSSWKEITRLKYTEYLRGYIGSETD